MTMTSRLVWVLVTLGATGAFAAKLTDAEKQKQKVEKKLDAFAKEYDAAKDLSRKGKEIERDIADLDKELDALAALDAAGAAELKGRRDGLVTAAKDAVGGAESGKASADLDKKFERAEKEFDPEKKNLLNLDQKALDRTVKELDGLIEKVAGDAKKPYLARRDALLAKVQSGVGEAKVKQQRLNIVEVPPVAPLPGVEAIAPMKPTWCEGVLESVGKLDTVRPSFPGAVPEVPMVNDVISPILASCLDPDWDVRQQVMAAWRQKLSNRLGLTAAMNERVLKLAGKLFALGDFDKKQRPELCTTQLAPLPSGKVEERGNRSLERIAVDCGNQRSDENRVDLRDVDVPGGLTSQLATGGVVWRVLPQSLSDGDAHWALTQASDVAVLNAALVFDGKQFEQQLEALQLNELGRLRAILNYFGARARLQAYVSLYKSLKVSGLQKVVFDAPAAGVKAFLAHAPEDKALLETVLSLEAQSAEDLTGCAQKLWPQVQTALKGQGQRRLSELELNPLLSYAVALCARQDKNAPGLEAIFTWYAERQPVVRGPMGAAYQAVFEAFNDASGGTATARGFQPGERSGSGGDKLTLPPPERSPVAGAELPDSVAGHNNTMDPERMQSGGVVKALEKHGDLVKVVFRTEKYIVPDLECVETNRIDRITPEGQIIYRTSCKKVGEHEETATAQPFDVPAWAVAGLAPGNLVTVMFQPVNSNAAGRGWIIESFESKARSKRTSLFGIAP